MQIVSFALAALAFAFPTLAKPISWSRRDAVSPPITNPSAGTVWRTGETQTITWDVTALNGARPSNPLAKIILGTIGADGQEKLMFGTPLLSGIPILGGKVTLTVPSVPTGDNYIICLFGSSDDVSTPFTIVGAEPSEEVLLAL
ncbi:hypothetical protein OH77DRAFT_1422287 [Trametes cingulata]|nr:hypothetical protein OH77DRAFT_1422287 [Trametes cingulata]